MFASHTSEEAGGYQIANSVRFRKSASARLSRAVTTTTNRRTFTYSRWLKLGELGSDQNLMMAFYPAANYHTNIVLLASGQLSIYDYNAGGAGSLNWQVNTSAKYRDPSGWMHVHLAVDTTQATPANRVKITVNGEPQTSLAVASYPALNFDCQFNVAGTTMYQNAYQGSTNFFDGGQADTYWIAGQAIDASYFGQFNADGVWVPKAYTGSYTDSNDFYLPFNDGSNLTNLCLDRSGNGNNWTASGVSLTAGPTYDWMVDTPTNNYCTLNPLDGGSSVVLSNGNLGITTSTSTASSIGATFWMTSGEWCWELAATATTGDGSAKGFHGIRQAGTSKYCVYYGGDGQKCIDGVYSAYGASYTISVIGFVYNADTGTLTAYKDGVSQGVLATGLTGAWTPWFADGSSSSGLVGWVNFGQRPMAYTYGSAKALNTTNMPAVAIANPRLHHEVVTVTKSGNTNFSIPWDATLYDTYFEIKRRDAAGDWYQIDGLRGYDKVLNSNTTAAEVTDANVLGVSGTTGTLKSSLADGTYVVSMWKAGLVSARQTNTDGSITSTVSANVTAGFSISIYNGPGGAGTVGHGLGATLAALTYKDRGAAGAWTVMHKSLPTMTSAYLALNSTAAYANLGSAVSAPTSTTFGVSSSTSAATTCVAYCHAEVPGYSRFGSFACNASADGPLGYLDFTAKSLELKASTNASNWFDWDTVRSLYNPMGANGEIMFKNTTGAEGSSGYLVDANAGAFKVRTAGGYGFNESGQTTVFMAYAKHPFGGSNVAPAPAR